MMPKINNKVVVYADDNVYRDLSVEAKSVDGKRRFNCSLEHIEWTKTMLLTPAQIKTINMLSGGEPFWTIEIDEAGKPSIVLDDSKYDPTDYEDDED